MDRKAGRSCPVALEPSREQMVIPSIDLSAFTVGDRVVSYCHDGLLEAEYALFDTQDVVISGVLGPGNREQGYETTAEVARQRLRLAGIGPDLAHESFAVLNRDDLHGLACTSAAFDVVDQLTACEAFEGGRFCAATRTFEGTWFDLETLANACPLTGVARILQILHLDLVLEEVDADAPISLLTLGFTAARVPGLRTWKKVRFDDAKNLPAVLRALTASTVAFESPRREKAGVREKLLRGLYGRLATSSPAARPRLQSLLAGLARTDAVFGSPGVMRSVVSCTPRSAPSRVTTPIAEAIYSSSGSQLFEEVSLEMEPRGSPDVFKPATFADVITESPDPQTIVALTVASATPSTALTHPSKPWKIMAAWPTEVVETLSLPQGATEDMFLPGERPQNPIDTRVAMTRLARTVGHDYRLWYGSSLQPDIQALEAIQQHLQRTFGDGCDGLVNIADLESECTRHGALLSEILARSLGAEWVDVSSERPQEWAMELPSEIRVCPIGRVRSFVQEGRREADLIAFYLALEAGRQPDAPIG
jgi:hypothetical protein